MLDLVMSVVQWLRCLNFDIEVFLDKPQIFAALPDDFAIGWTEPLLHVIAVIWANTRMHNLRYAQKRLPLWGPPQHEPPGLFLCAPVRMPTARAAHVPVKCRRRHCAVGHATRGVAHDADSLLARA